MAKTHSYAATVTWTGNTGHGTASYRGYSRDHDVEIAGKPRLAGSADPAFRGDPARHNPEDLLVASLSECHLLWYLALCSAAGVVVTGYRDEASGTMVEDRESGGHFTEVVLRPQVTVSDESMLSKAAELHQQAHAKCFIANSVNFPVRHEPQISVGS
ncbi:organic hydroperoxide reductase OsmC/OhrA [Saccharopolyspora erythraea NRRL 2338]|uniref:OsmC-like protein n=2 Tax=Saccharopolyspora erythraea TaxID=1836 RepID=A4FNJ4_SACEN|nr:OsmC family protein [Saccharopolyspora erythraea]EQD82129.1 peroxiredoxin [Saccharopolyspora erythraea D]PFG99257.1 organic hydroperoxide reductase OsmC/OhrA [Saccharopolyspora erythraea NRRL 2338]QRK89201.1 OsmC family protein [Saccharopolyspora erythraea]CAM05619.1 OsmC-like protein [Saccharopolyspora erythraea NRRL 2338]